MTKTHQWKADPAEPGVTAWQFGHGKPIPVWVARRFHDLGDAAGWTAIGADGCVMDADPGDWVVAVGDDTHGYTLVVLTEGTFALLYEPTPL